MAFVMQMLRQGFREYSRDQRGAYGVMFALMGGFIAAVAHVGVNAYQTQNSATAAEQLIDLTCQKLAYADPALYPTGEAAAAAAQLAEAQVRAYLSNVTPEQLFKMFNGGQSQASEQ